jgi:hypothetical protein
VPRHEPDAYPSSDRGGGAVARRARPLVRAREIFAAERLRRLHRPDPITLDRGPGPFVVGAAERVGDRKRGGSGAVPLVGVENARDRLPVDERPGRVVHEHVGRADAGDETGAHGVGPTGPAGPDAQRLRESLQGLRYGMLALALDDQDAVDPRLGCQALRSPTHQGSSAQVGDQLVLAGALRRAGGEKDRDQHV